MAGFPRGFPRRGEIYWVPLDKVRPGLVVSANSGNQHSDWVTVATLSTTLPDKRYPINVRLAAGDPLDKEGEIQCRSLYTLRKSELKEFRAELRPEQLAEVDRALATALGLPKPPLG